MDLTNGLPWTVTVSFVDEEGKEMGMEKGLAMTATVWRVSKRATGELRAREKQRKCVKNNF